MKRNAAVILSQDQLGQIRTMLASAMGIQALAFLSIAPIWLFVCILVFAAYLFFPKLINFKPLRVFVIAIPLGLFVFEYGKAYSVEMASVFLVMVASMKATELRSRRDVLVFVYAMFYLSAVSMLFEQGIFHVLLQLIVLMICFSLLMHLSSSSLRSIGGQFWSVVKLLSLALPFAVILFLFFPRMAPLWSLPIKTSHAQTGMSDQLNPGSIAQLSQSADRVFRATFYGETPARSQLYWRAMVLDRFDGATWSRSEVALFQERGRKGLISKRVYEAFEPTVSEQPYYDVIMEPHNQRWAYVLEGSEVGSNNIYALGMGVFEFKQDVVSPSVYRLKTPETASLVPGVAGSKLLKSVERVASHPRNDLRLPLETNPRARALVDELLRDGPTEMELVRRILARFRDQDFVYTLKPPLMPENPVDTFLFDARRGFCEHYASATAFLLREAGIPARVIVGYQGGEYNRDLNYWLIRQYDAHAWVEAYIEGTGWIRIDPTAHVAPDRVEQNLEQAVRNEGTFLADNAIASIARSFDFLTWAQLQAEMLNYHWQTLVLGYGESTQRSLFNNLFGSFSVRYLLWSLLILITVFATLLAVYLWLGRYRRDLSKQEKSYLRFLLILRVSGYKREQGETPRSFYKRVSEKLLPLVKRRLAKRTDRLEENLYNPGK